MFKLEGTIMNSIPGTYWYHPKDAYGKYLLLSGKWKRNKLKSKLKK